MRLRCSSEMLDEDTVYFRHQVKLYTLLSKIQKLRGMADLAFASLSAARKMQLQ